MPLPPFTNSPHRLELTPHTPHTLPIPPLSLPLSSQLPAILGQNPLARRLYVDHNNLRGTVPDSFDSCVC